MQKVAFITSDQLIRECNKIPVIKGRASIADELIFAYKLNSRFDTIQSREASEEDLLLFHSSYYVSYLKTQCGDTEDHHTVAENSDSDLSDSADDVTDEQLEYGLGYDCPKIRNLWKLATVLAGGTLTCADEILNGRKIAINWCGGWHHAQRDEAEGFCYVNDIAIAIQKLRTKFSRILYIDLDIHHGNGVENAFAFTKRIFTLSFHQYESGFYPGSGSVQECGFGQGRGYTANFPYKSNISGELFVKYFLKVFKEITSRYKPDIFVVQCGADVCAGDPLGGANVIPEDIGICISEILSTQLPAIFLGGGGYNFANTARYWTYLTSIICNSDKNLDIDIPDNRYFLKFSPDYELSIARRKIPDDKSTEEDFEMNFKCIKENLEKYGVHDC